MARPNVSSSTLAEMPNTDTEELSQQHFPSLRAEPSVLGEKESRWIVDATRFSQISRSVSQTRRRHCSVGLEAVCIYHAHGSRFRIATDVPLSRANHVAVQELLPGMRKVARSGQIGMTRLASQVRRLCSSAHFGDPHHERGDQ